MISDEGLLFIEPGQDASPAPVIDSLTRKVCAAFRRARPSDYRSCGTHECVCGARSTPCDYHLPGGDLTNSLCVHYVAHHRGEVPPAQLARVGALRCGEEEPNEQELQGPALVLAGVRASVEGSLGPDRLRTWTSWGLDLEAFCRGLRGGCLPAMRGYTPARQDAMDLQSILCCVRAWALPHLHEAVRRSHGDVSAWGADALRVPGWDRGRWMAPLTALMRLGEGNSLDRRFVAMSLRLLGPAAGAAIPSLLELAKGATGDLAHDVLLALNDIGRTPGVRVSGPAVPALVEVARGAHHGPRLRVAAARILGRSGEAVDVAVPMLLEMALRDVRNAEYAEAVLCGTLGQQFGYVGEPGVRDWGRVGLPLLLQALRDPDGEARRRAVRLLGRLGPAAAEAVDALREAGKDPALRPDVEEALGRIASPGPGGQPAEEGRTTPV